MAGPPSGGGTGISGDFSYIPGESKHYMINNNTGTITDLSLQQAVDLGTDLRNVADFSIGSDGALKAIVGNQIIKSTTEQIEIPSLVSQPSYPIILLDGFSLRFCEFGGGGSFGAGFITHNIPEWVASLETFEINYDQVVNKRVFDMDWWGITHEQTLSVFFADSVDSYINDNLHLKDFGLLVTLDGKLHLANWAEVTDVDFYFSSYNYSQNSMIPRYVTENGYCTFESNSSSTGVACYIDGTEVLTNTGIYSTSNYNYGYVTEKGLEASYSRISTPTGHEPVLLELSNSFIDIAWVNYEGSPHAFLVQLRSIPDIGLPMSPLNKIPIGNDFYLSGTNFDSLITPSGKIYTIPIQTDIDAPVPMPIKKPIEDSSYIYALTSDGCIAVINKSDGSFTTIPQTGGVRNLNLSACDDIQRFKREIATYLEV